MAVNLQDENNELRALIAELTIELAASLTADRDAEIKELTTKVAAAEATIGRLTREIKAYDLRMDNDAKRIAEVRGNTTEGGE